MFWADNALLSLKNTAHTSDAYRQLSAPEASSLQRPPWIPMHLVLGKCLGAEASGYRWTIVSFRVPKTIAKVLNKPKVTVKIPLRR